MTTILDMGIGSKKVMGIIKKIDSINVLRPNNKLQQKIVFTVVDAATNLEYKVSDAWVEFKDELIVRALWLFETPDGIYANSTLAKAMKYYNIMYLKDFIGLNISLYPDKNNYLTLVITNSIN